MAVTEDRISEIVEAVVKNIKNQNKSSHDDAGDYGIFESVNDAVEAASKSQQQVASMDIEEKDRLISIIRETSKKNAEHLAEMGVKETGLGRVDHKVIKNNIAATLTPGTEDLKREVNTGSKGICIVEGAPYGVIASILPVTHPGSCIMNHMILAVASGNAMIFLPHPKGQETGRETIRIMNKVMRESGGPSNLFVALPKATLEAVDETLKHPEVEMIMATGGPKVVEAALNSGKKAMGAGPGNPPVLVDETCDIKKAAKDIIEGHAFDNNIICIAEKEAFVVESVADEFERELTNNGGYQLKAGEIQRVTETVIKDGHAVPDYVGKDCNYILEKCGINTTKKHDFAWMEVDSEHPMVSAEQMMPILPVVRVKNFEEGVQKAIEAECGYRHTAIIHSLIPERISYFAKAIGPTIFVANAPSGAGLGIGSEGTFSHTLAEPTGEGVVTPKTLLRERRFVTSGPLVFI